MFIELKAKQLNYSDGSRLLGQILGYKHQVKTGTFIAMAEDFDANTRELLGKHGINCVTYSPDVNEKIAKFAPIYQTMKQCINELIELENKIVRGKKWDDNELGTVWQQKLEQLHDRFDEPLIDFALVELIKKGYVKMGFVDEIQKEDIKSIASRWVDEVEEKRPEEIESKEKQRPDSTFNLYKDVKKDKEPDPLETERMTLFCSIIRDICKTKDHADKDEIIRRAEEEGMDQDVLKETMKKCSRQGIIYEPRRGKYRLLGE